MAPPGKPREEAMLLQLRTLGRCASVGRARSLHPGPVGASPRAAGEGARTIVTLRRRNRKEAMAGRACRGLEPLGAVLTGGGFDSASLRLMSGV